MKFELLKRMSIVKPRIKPGTPNEWDRLLIDFMDEQGITRGEIPAPLFKEFTDLYGERPVGGTV